MENCELWSCVTGFSCEDKKGTTFVVGFFRSMAWFTNSTT